MQTEGSLAIGTQVSAKYKGAFCEAKVRGVEKLVKVRVVFKHGLGSVTISEKDIATDKPLFVGANVQARHPDKKTLLDAVVKEIKDQSRYTVTFNDGDIATLRRNALCMKSGKHFSASESLDNLPLTHPEHFRRGAKRTSGNGNGNANGNDSDDYDSSSDGEEVPPSYSTNIGRVVWAENTDKKCKTKDSWFPALIVAPSASDTVKIDTKEEFLIRSFKDGRYYTVSKKDTNKFQKDSSKKPDKENMKEAVDKAVAFLDRDELPPHWDRDILFNMGDDSTTESSESEELDEEDDSESPEEKDRLVAELYKHMEDRGQPINKNPTIDGREVDLYRLFKLVYKAGGQVRVTNKNMWQQVAKRLGFETTWCVNQVRVHYNRYLKSFEQLNRTLGCTMKMTHPKSGGRTQIRGIHRSGGSGNSKEAVSPANFVGATPFPVMAPLTVSTELDKPEEISDEVDLRSPVAPNPSKFKTDPVKEMDNQINLEKNKEEAEVLEKPVTPVPVQSTPRKVGRPKLNKTVEKQPKKQKNTPSKTKKNVSSTPKDNGVEETSSPQVLSSTPISEKKPKKRKMKLASIVHANYGDISVELEDVESLLKQAPQMTKEKRDAFGDIIKKNPYVRVNRSDVVEKEVRKLHHVPYEEQTLPNFASSFLSSSDSTNKYFYPEESFHDRRGRKRGKMASRDSSESADLDLFPDYHQYLSDEEEIIVGDKIKVFYKKDIIYEAKVLKTQQIEGERWPKFFVHYQGWNARYDAWIKRSRISQKLYSSKENSKNSFINDGEDLHEDSEGDNQIAGSSKQNYEPPSPNKSAKKSARGKSSPNSSKVERPRSLTPTSTNKGLNAISPPAKRQLVRSTSLKKDDESDMRSFQTVLHDDYDEARKSSRIMKTPTPEKRRKGRPRIHPEKREVEATKETNDEGDADDEDKSSFLDAKEEPSNKKHGRRQEPLKNVQNQNKKELEDKKTIRKTPIGRKKRPVTPVKEDDDDPYTFKEIEEGPSRKTPGRPGRKPKIPPKQEENSSSSDEDSKRMRDDLTPRSKSRLRKNRNMSEAGTSDNESNQLQDVKDELESDDYEEAIEGLQIERVETPPLTVAPIRTSEGKKGNVEHGTENSEKTLKVDKPPEVEIRLEGQPVLQLTKIQKELFPNLASIRTTSPSFSRSITPTNPSAISAESLDPLDGTMILNDNKVSDSCVGVHISGRSPDLISTVPAVPSLREISPQQTKSNVLETTSSPPQANKLNLSVATDQSNEVVSVQIASSTDLSQSQSPKSMPIGKLSGALHLAERSEVEIIGMSDEDEEVIDGAKTRQSRLFSLNQLTGQNTLSQLPKPSQGSSSNSKKQRKPPKKPNSSELVESDSDSGNERDKPILSSSQKSDFTEIIPEPALVVTSAPPKPIIDKRKDQPEHYDGEDGFASKNSELATKNSLVKGKRPSKKAKHKEDNMDLVCAEIIPCSPVQLLLAVATPNGQATSPFRKSEMLYSPKEQISDSLEMPFASRPSSSGELRADAVKEIASGALKDDTTDEDETVSPTTATSTSSGSPREFTNERSKSPAESSELDSESLNGQQKADSYEVDGDRREPFGNKRKPPPSPMDNRSPLPLHSKRKRRTRETQPNLNRARGSRGRNPDYYRGHDDELDDDDHPRNESDHTSLTSLDNEALLALTQKPTRKYNFFVEYDPSMDSSQRALLIQNSIKELQKTYKNLKSNLAMIERRRKKIRRKERERAEKGLSGNSADGSS